eukprot:g3543.t1
MWMKDLAKTDASARSRKGKTKKKTSPIQSGNATGEDAEGDRSNNTHSLDEATNMLNGVKKSVVNNIGKALRRVDDLEHVARRTEDLSEKSKGFSYSSKQLRDEMWWSKSKTNLVMLVLVVGFFWSLAAWICGGAALPICTA